jgi:tetratricopeptide (TPR) repeat protein
VTPKAALAAAGCVVCLAAGTRALSQETPPPAPPPASPPAAEGTALTPTEPDPAALAALQQAKDAFKTGTWVDAQVAAVKVLESQPKNLEALYIAGASERQINRLADAEGHLRTLVEASPNFPLSHFQLGYVLFLRAEGMLREGQVTPSKPIYLDAAAEFSKELGRNPTHAPSLSSRAIALSRGGQIDESVQAHEAWIAAVPQKNDPVVSLAATYAGAGRSTEAMATLDRLPDKSPKASFDATLGAANVFIARRDWSAAVPFLEKAVALDATSAHARALLTESSARAGLTDDAVRSLQTLLTMDVAPDEAERVGEAIKATMGDGKSAPSVPGVDPPALLRLPSPKYPTGPDTSIQTEVLVLALIRQDAAVSNTVVVPNRIWKDIRQSGFEAAAIDAVKRAKFAAGTKDEKPAELWLVVSVKFTR